MLIKVSGNLPIYISLNFRQVTESLEDIQLKEEKANVHLE